MPVPLPNLDNRTYNDLVEEALRMIPAHAPEWTNHNSSDPGITLIELFAYLTEMLLYRVNRITDDNVWAFLQLLNGPQWQPSASLDEEKQRTLAKLRQPTRAVTVKDFETLAGAIDPERIARVHGVPRRNLHASPIQDRPGHMSVVIVPKAGEEVGLEALYQRVAQNLEPRRLITTRVHVVGPQYAKVGVQLTLSPKPDHKEETVHAEAVQALRTFFTDGPQGNGWPFGRDIYISDIYQLLDRLDGIDYVTQTGNLPELTADAGRLIREGGQLVAVRLHPHELVEADIRESDITVRPAPTPSYRLR